MATKKPGRPTAYKPEYAKQVFHLALLGATDVEIADALDVDERTVNRWKESHPDFCQSLKDGKERADANVAKSLYRRALGYSHPAVKIMTVLNEVVEHEYVERYPPDTAAAIFWLKNRQRGKWRDKQDVELGGPDGQPLIVRVVRE